MPWACDPALPVPGEGGPVPRLAGAAVSCDRATGAQEAPLPPPRADAPRSHGAAGEPTRSAEGQPQGRAQHPRQRPVAYLLSLAEWPRTRRRDRRLSLLGNAMAAKLLDPIPPGEILYEEFMK